jgi:hypothetical protein
MSKQVVKVAARRLADVHGATFVRSLVMVPMLGPDPVGAIGVYWARPGQPDGGVVEALQRLTDLAVAALQRFPEGIPDPGFKVAALDRRLDPTRPASQRTGESRPAATPSVVLPRMG